jgi:hypothetical protein
MKVLKIMNSLWINITQMINREIHMLKLILDYNYQMKMLHMMILLIIKTHEIKQV